jgi:hypothetical protein
MTEQPVAGERVTVQLADLVLNEEFQIRLGKLRGGAVREYAKVYKAGGKMTPVKVAKLEGVMVLLDGWHRVAARKSLGLTDVKAEMVTTTRKEARWIAALANRGHGLQLTPKERREVFKAFVNADQHKHNSGRLKSYREIGAEIGRHHTTVRVWMRDHFPALARQYAKDEEEPAYPGGLMDKPVRTIGDDLRDHIETSIALAQGEISWEVRKELSKMIRVLSRSVKSGPWPVADWDDTL